MKSHLIEAKKSGVLTRTRLFLAIRAALAALLIAATLSGCLWRRPEPPKACGAVEVRTVEVEVIKPLRATLTSAVPEPRPHEVRTWGDALLSSETRLQALRECNAKLEAIKILQIEKE